MINFLKYVGCLLADLFGVALISEMLIRPIIYGTLGKEYHYVYMLIRAMLLLLIFFGGCIFISYKNDDKRVSFRESKLLPDVINGKITYREMIFKCKGFISEVVSYAALVTLIYIIFLPTMSRLGGVWLVIVDTLITIVLLVGYVFLNYYLTRKKLDSVVEKKRNLDALDEAQK